MVRQVFLREAEGLVGDNALPRLQRGDAVQQDELHKDKAAPEFSDRASGRIGFVAGRWGNGKCRIAPRGIMRGRSHAGAVPQANGVRFASASLRSRFGLDQMSAIPVRSPARAAIGGQY